MAKKGYAYRKAIELIAYEQGKGALPSIPKSPSKRGAIQSWKKKIQRGYRPKSIEAKKEFDRTISKYDIYETRPFLKVENQFHSKRIGNDIQDVVNGFSISEKDDEKKSPSLLTFDDDDYETLIAIADELGTDNNAKTWNKKIKQSKIDAFVWNEKYLRL